MDKFSKITTQEQLLHAVGVVNYYLGTQIGIQFNQASRHHILMMLSGTTYLQIYEGTLIYVGQFVVGFFRASLIARGVSPIDLSFYMNKLFDMDAAP